MSRPLLTIVTPVLNGARFLPQAIESVAQAARLGLSIEHIIADGGSVDGTLEIARSAMSSPGSPITQVLSGPDSGQANAINRALAVSSGFYVGWLNADDMYLPEGLVRLSQAMKESRAEVVLGRCRFVDTRGRDVFVPIPPDPVTPESLLRLISGWFAGRSIVQPEAFVLREAFERIGGVDESLHYTMDHNLWVRLAAAGASFHAEPVDVALQLAHAGQKTADNLAVVREMLTYSGTQLAQRPESPERDRAEHELSTVARRLRLAREITGVLDSYAEGNASAVAVHGVGESISDRLIQDLTQNARGRKAVLLAGLGPAELRRITRCVNTKTAPVIVGRLPMVRASFDLVITAKAGFAGISSGFDVQSMLKPNGTLCIAGASPMNVVQESAKAIRKSVADQVTFKTSNLLDGPDSHTRTVSIKRLLSDSRVFDVSPSCRLEFRQSDPDGAFGARPFVRVLREAGVHRLAGSVILRA